jgi:hypothetical protein
MLDRLPPVVRIVGGTGARGALRCRGTLADSRAPRTGQIQDRGNEREHWARRAGGISDAQLRHAFSQAAGRTTAGLSGVAAVSASSAWAVGCSSNCAKTLILRWNGTAWK